MRDPVKLIMVTEMNNNKYYNMVDNGDGTMTVTYGRVGKNPTTMKYDIYEWDRIYRQKTGKGYKDVTDLYRQQASTGKYKAMDDDEIETLITQLQNKSRQFTGKYYDNSVTVTQEMLIEAQDILNDAALCVGKNTAGNLNDFNKYLLKLFSTLPRMMGDVRSSLCSTGEPKEMQHILQREQDLIDNLKAQAVTARQQLTVADDKTICDALGIVVSKCSSDDMKIITDNLVDLDSRYKLNRAWVVRNNARDEGFDEYLKNNGLKNNNKNVKTYWHGTGTENVFSIMATALQLNPSNAKITGKMFGNGIYSAPKAKKSLGYTSLAGSYWKGGSDDRGYMFLNAVITGNTLDVYDNNEIHNGIRIYNLDGDSFSSKLSEYHSVYAHAGSALRNDEVIVYNQNQVASRYLVEITYK